MKNKLFLLLFSITSVITFSETISEIQGITHDSPYKGKEVRDVEGVVTAVYNTKYNKGFFMQSLNPDKDNRTSEGIWVKGFLDVKKGDLVKVNGKVEEIQFSSYDKNSLNTTAINASNVDVLGDNYTVLPYVISSTDISNNVSNFSGEVLDVKNNASDYYESLESMLVLVKDPLITGAKEAHGEISVLPDNGNGVINKTNNGGVLYSYNNEQTHRILVGDEFIPLRNKKVFKDKSFTPNPGDKFNGDIEGIIAYSFGNYKLYNTKELPEIINSGAKVDTNKYVYDFNKLNVVSYNIENFNYLQKGRSEKLANQINTILQKPDIIGLVEVQDDDGDKNTGVTSASKSALSIIEAIEKLGGPKYSYVEVEPINNQDGGAPGANIRNIILYRVDRLKLKDSNEGSNTIDTKVVEDSKELKLTFNPGRIGNSSEEFKATRKPLIAHFDFNGKDIIVILNHLSSKRSDLPIYGNKKAVRYSEVNRIKQAESINKFVKEVLNKNSETTIISMGDMNDFEFSPTISTMEGNELFTVIKELPENERHTYVHQGNSQVLDHILINNKYRGNVNVDVLNINSEFTEHQGSFSDHDPVFIQFEVK